MLMPYLSGYLSSTLGLATWAIGLVLGLRTFSQQGLHVLGGTLADHVGYTAVIAGGCALRMVGFLLFGFADTLSSVLVAALLSGLGGALFAPAARAYLASAAGAQRLEAFALFQVCEGLGACLGPLLGVVLLQGNFRWVCIMASGLFLVLTILQLRSLPPQHAIQTVTPRPVRHEWQEVLANRRFVVFAVSMVAYLTLYNQLYLSLPLEIRRLHGNDAGTGLIFALSALLSVLAQVRITTYLQAHWRPFQAITLGLVLMGGAFLPILVARPFLPIHALPIAVEPANVTRSFLVAAINLSPVVLSVVCLWLGIMTLQPFAQSLIPVLSRNRLLGTYFGFYYLVQGRGAVLGNLAIGSAFDLGRSLGFPGLPWLLMLGLGLASACSLMAIDRSEDREALVEVA